MRLIRLILLNLSLLPFMAQASESPRTEGTTFSCGEISGTNYCQVVTRRDADSFPTWSPAKAECPLSMKEAVSLARERIKGENFKVAKWDLVSIRLSPLWDTDKWLYSISFLETEESKQTQSRDSLVKNKVRVVVALNRWVPQFHMTEIKVKRENLGHGAQRVVISPKSDQQTE